MSRLILGSQNILDPFWALDPSVVVTSSGGPDLSVGLTSDKDNANVIAGADTVTYTATVGNVGDTDNTGYTLTFNVPASTSAAAMSATCSGTGPVTCTSTGLPSGQSEQFTLTLNIGHDFANAAPNTGVTLSETASVSGQTPADTSNSNDSATDATVNVVGRADLAATLDADHSSNNTNPALAGANVAYTAQVTNNGPSDNTAYTLTFDNLPAGTTFVSAPGCTNNAGSVSCTSTTPLAPNHSNSYTLTLKTDPSYADSAQVAGVRLTENATLSALTPSDQGNVTANDSQSRDVLVVAQADLATTVSADHSTDSSNPAIAGTNVTYTAQVTNNGPSDNTGYTLTFDNIPAGTTFVSAPGCTNNAGSVSCTSTATLAPGNSNSYTLTLKIDPSFADSAPTAGVTLTEAAGVSGLAPADQGGATSNDSASQGVLVVARADLQLTATPTVSHPVAGGAAEDYDIKVKNLGPSDAVGGYKATAPLPTGTSPDGTSDSTCAVASNTITCDRTGATTPGTLAPNATDEFHVVLDPAASYGDASNTDQTQLELDLALGSFGTQQPANSTANDTASPTVTVYSEADLTTMKSQATPGTPLPTNTIYANSTAAQNTVTFTVSVSNGGVSDAHNVQINDALNSTLLTGAQYCVITATTCTPNQTYSGSLSVGTLAAGATQTFLISAHANATLGHANGPASFTGPGPYTNHNTGTAVSSTPAHTTDQRTSSQIDTTIDTVPAPPTIVQFAVPGNGSGAVEWSNAGEGNGGRPITGYTLKACLVSNTSSCVTLPVGPNPNATANQQPVFSYVISGLTNASAYQFTVFATNDVGNSDSAAAGTATPSTAAFANVIPTTGAVNADTGFSAGAQTCSDPTAVTCNDIVGKYSFTDTHDVGSVYNLDAEPNNPLGNSFLRNLASPTPLLQCMDVISLDPGSPNFGVIENSPDGCGPSNKVIRATYPVSPTGSAAPHLEYEQLDASITTLTRGAPCFAYSPDSTGTAQCTNPAFKKIYTDPFTGKPTNFCPAEFNPSSNIGWTAQKPCAFVNYITVRIPGFNIIGTSASQPIRSRPIACSPDGVGNCGKAAIVGSSLTFGVIKNGNPVVPGWCAKNLTVVPCIFKVQWLNNSTSNGNNDIQIQDYEVGDLFKGGGSG